MSRYKWLIFDADGTLFDYDRAELTALNDTLGAHNLDFDSKVHRQFIEINTRLWKEFELGSISSEQLRVQRFQELATNVGFRVSAPEISEDYLRSLGDQCHLLPGAEQLVADLSRAFKLVLATNGIASVQRSRFFASPINVHFESLVISDEIGYAKPAPEYFERVFDEIGDPDKSQVLMVGDSLSSDIAGGIGFGIDTCWFNPDNRDNESSFEPTYQVSRLTKVSEIARLA